MATMALRGLKGNVSDCTGVTGAANLLAGVCVKRQHKYTDGTITVYDYYIYSGPKVNAVLSVPIRANPLCLMTN